jgi:acyl-[acyl-carrier-protein]-phospholipid O-acyltransferase/long-chain-fatty-acid--[acyl-carrier-protein] ligase
LRFIRAARKNWSRFAMADSTGRELTYGRALAASLMVARWANRENYRAEKMIGVLLPSSCGGALANLGLTMA